MEYPFWIIMLCLYVQLPKAMSERPGSLLFFMVPPVLWRLFCQDHLQYRFAVPVGTVSPYLL